MLKFLNAWLEVLEKKVDLVKNEGHGKGPKNA
jgi:hypothetical protein